MKKINSFPREILLIVETVFVIAYLWIFLGDFGLSDSLEEKILAFTCVISGFSLLMLSIVLRKISPFYSNLGFLILFIAMVIAAAFPRV